MLKLTDSTSFKDELNISVITQDYFSTLQKTAANEAVAQYLAELLPKVVNGKAYFHINAMGAGEYYGANRNGDYFPEEQLLKYYPTFMSNPAHLFRHHINKDPSIANGKVIFATYNSNMHRVELIAEADKSLVKDIEARIAAGDFPATSMACKTPYDVCSICGNQAHSRAEYCTHLRNELGKVYPDGRKVMALNSGPLSFFDISVVLKGADPTSFILTKVAGVEPVVGGAERAELEKLEQPRQKLVKLSELVKNVDTGLVTKVELPVDNLPDFVLVGLAKDSWENITKALATEGILPSIKELAHLYYLKHGEEFDPELIERLMKLDPSLPVPESTPELGTGTAAKLAKQASARCSLKPELVEKRAFEGNQFLPEVAPLTFTPSTPTPRKVGVARKLLFAISALGAAVVAYRTVYNSLVKDPYFQKVAGLKLRSELL
jgi:hypothetical protein